MNTFFTVIGVAAVIAVCVVGALWALGIVEIHFSDWEDYYL